MDKPNKPNKPSPGWVVTRGAKQVPNIIAIQLFRHYEKQITRKQPYQIIAIGYINKEQTELGIYEAEEITNQASGEAHNGIAASEGFAISTLFKHWFMHTLLYQGNPPCLLALVKIEDDIILMTLEEFYYHSRDSEGLAGQHQDTQSSQDNQGT